MNSITENRSAPRSSTLQLRWWIAGLIFLITCINYIDRSSVGLLVTQFGPEIRDYKPRVRHDRRTAADGVHAEPERLRSSLRSLRCASRFHGVRLLSGALPQWLTLRLQASQALQRVRFFSGSERQETGRARRRLLQSGFHKRNGRWGWRSSTAGPRWAA